LSRKRKKPTEDESSEEITEVINKNFIPVFSPEFKTDLRWWYRQEPKKGDSPLERLRQRIMDLVADILDGEPFAGLGKPEPLKYVAANTWSRRIDLEHRLVYQIDNNRIIFLQARYHYNES
jgi:toxin YoeB